MSKILWDVLPHPTTEHVVRTYWREGDQRGGDYARTEGELERFRRAMTGRNAYVAPNPTKHTIGDRHSAADVTHWSFLLVDIDPVMPDPNPFAVSKEVLNLMRHWVGYNPSVAEPVIIDSGRGCQLWFRLEDIHLYENVCPLPGEGLIPRDGVSLVTERKTARKTMGYWLNRLAESIGESHGCKIDTSTSDLPRLMRMPGTVNQKTGRLANFLSLGTGPIIGLAERLVQETPAGVYVEREILGAPGRSWQAAFGELTRRAQTYLTSGWTEPGRHVVMWHTAKCLAEQGCDVEEARKALVYGNSLQGEDQELEPSDIENALTTAFGA